MDRRRARTAGGIGLVLLVAVVAALLGYVETRAARSPAGPVVTAGIPVPPAVAGAAEPPAAPPPGSPGPVAVASRVSAALAPALRSRSLGARLRADVLDARTGRVLLDRGGSVPAAPASTAKLLTAAALLTVRAPTDRITTTVLDGGNGTVVLVGAGDPTLTAARTVSAAPYPHAARLADLAAGIRARHVPVRRIVVDDSAFSGPTVSPGWAADDVPTDYAAAVTAVMTDGGRAAPRAVVRSAQPDLAAGRELAAALGRPGLPVRRGRAASGAAVLASVRSAPFSVLVAQMLLESDNVVAECLGRQVALAEHRPASFTGAAAAIRTALRGIGVDVGAGMIDASGLAAGDRLTTTVLAHLLHVVAAGAHPALATLVGGLPVAAWSGTLDDRFIAGSARAGAGVVRAKTGTLTGVSALAGLVHDRDGRLLAFALVADRDRSTPETEAALDVIAARLARCGCS